MRTLEQVLKEIKCYDAIDEWEIDNPKLDIIVYDNNGILLTGNAQTLLDVAGQQLKELKVINELYNKDYIGIEVQS